MSASNKGSTNGAKRNLPIWMSSRGEGSKSHEEPADDDSTENRQQGGAQKVAKGYGEKANIANNQICSEVETGSSDRRTRDFSKLLEGVVLVLSGFVNPERGNLRSQALAMGAEYQPDWNSNCTLLVCAFANTPKFRQVQAQCGTIVSKEWITECYTQKNLVDIDSYLMHPGKPWRKSGFSHAYTHDDEAPQSRKSRNKEEAHKYPLPESSGQSKESRSESSMPVEQKFSPLELKKWAADDLKKTITWLQSQDEKPEPSEIQKVAAGGVLACLQDAIGLLEQKQNVQQLTESWSFLPRVVEELIKMEDSAVPNDVVHKQALSFKETYEEELNCVDGNPTPGKGEPKTSKDGTDHNKRKGEEVVAKDNAGYDSDETIEMTEEEIDLAFENMTSKHPM